MLGGAALARAAAHGRGRPRVPDRAMKLIAVHAFVECSDETPEAIFTVAARDEAQALELVRADDAGAFYDRLSIETYAEAAGYPEAAIIAFERVRR